MTSFNRNEIIRLIKAFNKEAAKLHDVSIEQVVITQSNLGKQEVENSGHYVLLWQYYGSVGGDDDIENLLENLKRSDLQIGMKGAELSQFAIVKGKKQQRDKFIKLALRAGNLFNKEQAEEIKRRVLNDITDAEKKNKPSKKPISVVNDNGLAIWINYLIYYLSITHSGREFSRIIQPEPFTLSLLVLEKLLDDGMVGKSDRSNKRIEDLDFEVAVSFPGEQRKYVSDVMKVLRKELGVDKVFYDLDYQAQLARPNLDTLLQSIYHKRSKLIVVFLATEYNEKEWCGLEMRAIRDIIKSKDDERLMFVKFDDAVIEGLFSIDGYIDAKVNKPRKVAEYILERVKLIKDT
ncbi:TIR domain-containing protein [Amylibacter sp. SFDW26]|uniref:TIR domain-containing protein n=1 Tax=Amylibacter sp. SFDW26 TaxID=2652722 RepID=UPI00126237E6|nr:TIR domain-containing protein [Amylibacter sp. SFDW26]KAB7613301.1 TIR domain-containing protein [Amylibacter sp. SFDW26]